MGRYLDTNSCVLSLLLRSDELGVLVTCSRPIATKQQELGRQGCKYGAFDKQTDSVCLLVQVHLDDIFGGGLKAEIIYNNIFTQTDLPLIEVTLKIILDKNIQQYMVKMVKGTFKRKKTPGKSISFSEPAGVHLVLDVPLHLDSLRRPVLDVARAVDNLAKTT